MSHFYGIIQAGEKQTTRCGHKTTGLETIAASWKGEIVTRLYHDEAKGLDMFEVVQEPHQGQGCREVVARGVVGEPLPADRGLDNA